jgi:hypothetical protein
METSSEVLNEKPKMETGRREMLVVGRGHENGMCMAFCRDNLQKEALLLNFIGQLLMLVTNHFTYECQILYQSAVFSLQFHLKSW